MPATIDPWFKELEVELYNLRTQSVILQRRKNGSHRLRWRERDEYGHITHKSEKVPDELVEDVRRVVEKLAKKRNAQKKLNRKIKQVDKRRKQKYKALRRKVREEAPGGRIAKLRAVELLDKLHKNGNSEFIKVYMECGAWLLPWYKPGRPRKTSPRMISAPTRP